MAQANLRADSVRAYPESMLNLTFAAGVLAERLDTAIEALIALRDAIDGDSDIELTGDENEDSEGVYAHQFDEHGRCVGGGSDLVGRCEDDEDDDPAGGNVDDDGEGEPTLHMLPRYAIDQSAGPINERAAIRDHYRRMGVR